MNENTIETEDVRLDHETGEILDAQIDVSAMRNAEIIAEAENAMSCLARLHSELAVAEAGARAVNASMEERSASVLGSDDAYQCLATRLGNLSVAATRKDAERLRRLEFYRPLFERVVGITGHKHYDSVEGYGRVQTRVKSADWHSDEYDAASATSKKQWLAAAAQALGHPELVYEAADEKDVKPLLVACENAQSLGVEIVPASVSVAFSPTVPGVKGAGE